MLRAMDCLGLSFQSLLGSCRRTRKAGEPTSQSADMQAPGKPQRLKAQLTCEHRGGGWELILEEWLKICAMNNETQIPPLKILSQKAILFLSQKIGRFPSGEMESKGSSLGDTKLSWKPPCLSEFLLPPP